MTLTANEFLELVVKDQKKWEGVCVNYGSTTPYDDVQDAYLRAYEYLSVREPKDHQNPEGLFFFIVKSIALSKDKNDKISDNAIDFELSGDTIESEETTDDEEYNIYKDDAVVDIIHRTVDNFDWFERKLCTVYFNLDRKNSDKMSMRKLAKETGIALPTIFNTIKTCKAKIKEEIENYLIQQ